MNAGRMLAARVGLPMVVAALVGLAVPAAGQVDDARSLACAEPAAQVLSVDASAARRIYDGELHGRELQEDVARVRHSRALIEGLASADDAAVRAAVQALVYAPHWHIVRLRIVRAGRILADVGGPSVIAPVSGPLRVAGRTVAKFVISVQDDVGYVKLVSRFIGVPVDIYRDGSFLLGTLTPAPSVASTGGSVSVGGRAFQVQLLSAQAFPAGPLEIGLFATRTGSRSAAGCSAVRVAAWGSIARHIAARFTVLTAQYQDLVDVLRSTTGGLAYVRIGGRHLAGAGGPARLPSAGTVRYRGRSWSVYSWRPAPPARVYLLIPST